MKKNQETVFQMFLIASLMLSVITILIHLYSSGMLFEDHSWYWKECACTLKGVDSAEAIKQGLYFEDIGQLPDSTATLPWMKIIGVLVHGSFLPYKVSCIYYVFLNLAFFAWTARLVYIQLLKELKLKKAAVYGILSMFTSWYLVDWIQQGNNATLVCLCIIAAICIMEKHEITAGILLGFSMMKPQIVLPFYVVWLLFWKWKAIIVSAAIVLSSWIASVIITGIGPIKQLSNVFGMSLSYDRDFWIYGIFNPLRKYGYSSTTVLIMSMILGLTICTAFTIALKNNTNEKWRDSHIFFVYIIPAIVSVFWCYKSQCDYNILIIVVLGIVEYWYHQSAHNWVELFAVMLVIVVDIMKPFNLLNAMLGMIGVVDRNMMVGVANHVDLYMKTIVTIGFVLWIAYKERKIKCG